MPKTVFMSHVVEETEMAQLFAERIEKAFLGGVKFFVSSRADNLRSGERWLNRIEAEISDCSMLMALISPLSVNRPWINFEIGAAWSLSKSVVPICHSGMIPANLPMPLVELNAIEASNPDSLFRLFHTLSKMSDLSLPSFDFQVFAKDSNEIEKRYTFWDRVNNSLMMLFGHNVLLTKYLLEGKTITLQIKAQYQDQVENSISFFTKNKIFFSQPSGTSIGPGGMAISYSLTPMEEISVLRDSRCVASKWISGY